MLGDSPLEPLTIDRLNALPVELRKFRKEIEVACATEDRTQCQYETTQQHYMPS